MRNFKWGLTALLLTIGLTAALSAFARDSRILIQVRPSQAYIFVDGQGKGDASTSGNRKILLVQVAPGEHTVSIYNYGYTPVIRKVDVPDGTTVIQAADRVGVEIPHYCWHPGLPIAGNCRMCLVEIERMPKLQIACNTRVTDGMVVHTTSEKTTTQAR